MKRLLLVVLVMSACTTPAGPQGEKGERGDVGPAGAKGDTGASATSVHWIDADGKDVGPWLVLVDGAGVQWPLDMDSGEISAQLTRFIERRYATPDCQGSAHVEAASLAPRQPFTIAGVNDVLVRGDTQQSVTGFVTQGVKIGAGACIAREDIPLSAIKVDECRKVTSMPSRMFRGPLHTELR